MLKRLCWVSFHPFLTVHTTKDTGKIPEMFSRVLGWNAQIIRFNKDPIQNQNTEIPDVELVTLQSKKVWRFDLTLIHYLLSNSKHIDVLLIYHFDINTFFYGLLYKIINPKGFFWNKLDLNEDTIRAFPHEFLLRKPIKRFLFKFLLSIYFKKVDLISSESRGNLQLFLDNFPQAKTKLVYLPNGVDDAYLPVFPDVTREKIILTVARLGTWEKRTELLLEAFNRSHVWPEWKLVLIGPVEDSFTTWLESFQKLNPEVQGSIEWIGKIDSREELARWYQKAMVFCLPSRFESFALALLEAGYYGCACIASDFASAFDILDHGQCGLIFKRDNPDTLELIIIELCRNLSLINLFSNRVQELIRSKYRYETIIKTWHQEYLLRHIN